MAVNYIFGRAGAGKTRHCLDAILGELRRSPVGPRLILIVPEQATFQMERQLALAAPGGGFTRAEVLSFTRLAHRVINETGAGPMLVDSRLRSIALRFVAARLGGELTALRPALKTQGFYEHLNDLLTELMQEDVSPDDLVQAADKFGADPHTAQRLRELGILFSKYRDWLGVGRTDAAMCQELLRARLRSADWLPEARVWVDGFAGFTRTEQATLVELSRGAAELFITQLIDPESPVVADPRRALEPLDLFYRTEQTYVRLHEQLTRAGAELRPPLLLRGPLPRFSAAPELALLEKRLVGRPDPMSSAGAACPARAADEIEPAGDGVRVLQCATHRDELRAAARWIRATIADSGGQERFRDFALITRDLAPFADLVAEVFDEFEIPYFIDRRRPLRGHPLTRLLPALIDAALTDLDPAVMIRLLRTQLLPLGRAPAEELENLLLVHGMRGRASWAQPEWELEAEPDRYRTAEQNAAACSAPRRISAHARRRQAILDALRPLLELDCLPTASAIAERLARVLEGLGVRRRIEEWIADARQRRDWEVAQTHAQAWTRVCELLENLHAGLADQPTTLGEVREIIESALAEQTLGVTPPGLDQVLVSAIERSRHPDVRHAWLFGFNEGLFPARPAEDRLLSARERDALQAGGLSALESHRDDVLGERLLMYIALTRPSASITVSFAEVSDLGEDLFPSPLLGEFCSDKPAGKASNEMNGHLPLHILTERDPPPAHLSELARGYLRARESLGKTTQLGTESGERPERYLRLFQELRQNDDSGPRLAWLTRGIDYRNRPQPLGNFRHPHDQPDIVWRASPSEIEAALQCPFRHFARYGLRLREDCRPQRLDLQLGSLAHELLAVVIGAAIRESAGAGGVLQLSESRWEQLLDEAIRSFEQRQPGDRSRRQPELAFKRQLLRRFVGDVLQAQVERWRRGGFAPLRCEQGFGLEPSSEAPAAMLLDLPGLGRISVRGKIDRIDVATDASGARCLLVYDYKSGQIFSLHSKPFLTSHRLQVHLYMRAVQHGLGGEPATVGGGLLLPIYPKLEEPDDQDDEDTPAADPRDAMLQMFRPRGLIEQDAARLLDRGLSTQTSPVANLRLRQDGSFYKNCDARPAAEFADRLELAERTLVYVADAVVRGTIQVSPLVENRRRACKYCDFAPLCRFDPAYNRSRPAEVVLPRLGDRRTDEPEPAASEANQQPGNATVAAAAALAAPPARRKRPSARREKPCN